MNQEIQSPPISASPEAAYHPEEDAFPAGQAEGAGRGRGNRFFLLFLSGGILLLFVTALFFSLRARFTRSFTYRDFYSYHFEKEEPKETTGWTDVSGVFVYGPYFRLDRGTWEGTVFYSSENANSWELTADYGMTQLISGALDPGSDRLSFTVELEESIPEDSLELRIWYSQGGSLRLDGFTIQSPSFPARFLCICLLFLGSFLAICALLRRPAPEAALLLGLPTLLLGGAMASDFRKALLLVPLILLTALLLLKQFSRERLLAALRSGDLLFLGMGAFFGSAAFLLIRQPEGILRIAGGSVLGMGFPEWLLIFLLLFLLIRLLGRQPFCSDLLLFLGAYAFGMAAVRAMRLSQQPASETLPVTVGVLVVLLILTLLLSNRNEELLLGLHRRVRGYRLPFAVLCGACLACILFYSWQTIARYRVFGGSCFDMGIFAQMFSYMARTGLPLTTCERGELLSHFYIHLSPIYYLLLPFYLLRRSPETLLILQAVFVCAACIPLFLICRQLRMAPLTAGLFSLTWLALPAITQPLFYDFHENAFLPFFLFWFLLFYLQRRTLPAFLFLLFSLMVKEEAAIYLLVLEFCLLITGKERRQAAVSMAFTVLYFSLAMAFIQYHGLGLMEGHYGLYYRGEESGFFVLARNILFNPAFFLKNVFDPDNIPYIFYTLGSLLFLPLVSRDPKRLLLLLPFVAFGLMTDYVYQHDIGYQYTYGSMALMVFACVLNIKDLPVRWQVSLGTLSLCASLMLSFTYRGDGFFYYGKAYREKQEDWDARDALLQTFPADESVTADTFLLPHMSYVEELYMYEETTMESIQTEFVILASGGRYGFRNISEDLGYRFLRSEAGVDIYRREQ